MKAKTRPKRGEREARWCEWCRKRLRRGDGIRIGISVQDGVLKVCDHHCRLAYNLRGRL